MLFFRGREEAGGRRLEAGGWRVEDSFPLSSSGVWVLLFRGWRVEVFCRGQPDFTSGVCRAVS